MLISKNKQLIHLHQIKCFRKKMIPQHCLMV
nr:MAG TPA: hypothetical protein [Caudoviricetes sp.]